MVFVPTDEPHERYVMQRPNSNHHGSAHGEGTNARQQPSSHRHHYSSSGGRRRRGGGAAAAAMDDGFGEFPPQLSTSAATPQITTPQTTGDAPQSSRIRFAEDTRLSPIKSNQVLVLGSGSGSAARHTRHQHQQSAAPSASKMPEQAPSSLDFSMIATPGGKLARMVDDDGFFTPSEASGTTTTTTNTASSSVGRWTTGTPFSSILRGVVSSTPSINPRQLLTSSTPYTSARDSLSSHNHQHQNQTPGNDSNNNDNDNECTALAFARSAPLSGHLRKLGKNIPTFKRRFFVLKPSTHLYYFLSPNDTEPRGCIDLDTVREDGNGEEGGSCCEVREIGSLADGTFRFELLFDEESGGEEDGASTDTGSPSQNARRRNFRRRSIVLEARTEEIGREWMGRLQSERLSTAKDEVDFLTTRLSEMTSISGRWETSACEEAMRADEVERQRNAAISEAKSWEGKFTDLNEAIRLLVRKEEQKGASSDFLTEAFQGLDVDGTNFNDVSRAFSSIHNEYNHMAKREEDAKERILELEKRAEEAESLAANAESELNKVWEDNRTMQHDLKKTRREKKILVKEVRSWHASAEENASKQSARCDASEKHTDPKQHCDLRSTTNSRCESRGTASDGASITLPRPKRKLNDEERRLVIELEEHVMSGLRLSEQFLTLNGIDPSEVGDDLDDSVQTSIHQASCKSSIERSPERQSKCFLPPKAILNLSPHPTNRAANNETLKHYGDNPLGSLFDENDDESEAALVSAEVSSSTIPGNAVNEMDRNSDVDGANRSYTAESTHGSDLLNDIYQYEDFLSGDNPVNQNLNERFREQIHIDTSRERGPTNNRRNTQPTFHIDENSADRAPPSLDVASSISESSRSRITDNGNATTKLECPLRDVGETPTPMRSNSTMGEDGKVYHITFYSNKIGLQFQKVPNEIKSTGLLTEAMTADHGPNVETNQTAAELRRIASMSQQHPPTRNHQGGQAMECHPVTPTDAVLVCGFVGFDGSTGNVRPRIGARVVAFDGIPVEVGKWTFESIRKSIQARGRPLTLSFRNDFLTPKQRAILTKAIEDVKPPLPSTAHSHVPRGNSSTRERYQDHHHENTIYTCTSSLSSQRSQPKSKYYSSFSEAGSSISSAVAPLMSNLLSNTRSSSGKQQGGDLFAPDYLRRTSDSLEKMRHHHDYQSGLL